MSNTNQNINHYQKTIKDLCEELAVAKKTFQHAKGNYNALSMRVRTHKDFDYEKHSGCVNDLTRDGMTKAYAKDRAGNMARGAGNMARDAGNMVSSFFKNVITGRNKVAPTQPGP